MNIAVDMNAYCCNGSNGGAAPLTISILKKLAADDNITLFLITESHNYDSLAYLDCPSIHRICMDRLLYPSHPFPEKFTDKLSNKLMAVKNRSRMVINKCFGLKYPKIIPVNFSKLLHVRVDLLYCPFTSINYYDRNVPIVITLHDIQQKYYPDFFSSEELKQRDIYYSNICKIQPTIIAISNFTKKVFSVTTIFPKIKSLRYILLCRTDSVCFLRKGMTGY